MSAASARALESARPPDRAGEPHPGRRGGRAPRAAGAERVLAGPAAGAKPAAEPGPGTGPGRSTEPPAVLDPDIQPDLDRLAEGVDQAAGLLAATLRGLGQDPAGGRPPVLPPLPQLRPQLQAMWRPEAEAGADGGTPAAASASGERGGLFTAADGLVDAINTAAHVLRRE